MVITPKAVARLLRQVAGAIRRVALGGGRNEHHGFDRRR